MNIPMNIFKAYDIRGIYPSEINEKNIVPVIQAIYSFFHDQIKKPHITIVLGRDMRLSSPSLFEIAKQILVSAGANVIDVGLISTPSFYFAVFHYGYDAGIQITASHNPKDYNGIKIVRNNPHGLIKIGASTGMNIIKSLAQTNISLPIRPGSVEKKKNILNDEIINALDVIGSTRFDKFKIAADPGNAMGAQYIEALFNKIPAKLIKINFNLDGSFPSHEPDPLDPKNLIALQKKVLEEKADFGLAPDGDGDRLFFIDELGQVVPPAIITALVARELLKKNPGATILFDIRYILTPQKIVEENGGKWQITRVGHAFITEAMNESGAIFAGESSAHYYYRFNGNAESQIATILCVLKVLTQEKKKLSEIVAELRRSYESGEYNFNVKNAQQILHELKVIYKDGKINMLDGIAISYSDWRFNVRISNTEPLLRLNVEAFEQPIMLQKLEELKTLIESLIK